MAEAVLAADAPPVPKLLRDAPFLGKEARRRLLQHLLVVRKQAHARTSSLCPSAKGPGAFGKGGPPLLAQIACVTASGIASPALAGNSIVSRALAVSFEGRRVKKSIVKSSGLRQGRLG